MIEDRQEQQEELVSWRSLSNESEKVENQNKWILKILIGLLTITAVVVTIWFLLSRNILR